MSERKRWEGLEQSLIKLLDTLQKKIDEWEEYKVSDIERLWKIVKTELWEPTSIKEQKVDFDSQIDISIQLLPPRQQTTDEHQS